MTVQTLAAVVALIAFVAALPASVQSSVPLPSDWLGALPPVSIFPPVFTPQPIIARRWNSSTPALPSMTTSEVPTTTTSESPAMTTWHADVLVGTTNVSLEK